MLQLIGLFLALNFMLSGCSTFNEYKISKLDYYTYKIINTEKQAQGTAFSLNYHGDYFTVTNAHVCGDASYLHIKDKPIKVLSVDKKNDLCLLQAIRQDGLRIEVKTIPTYTKVYIMGYPGGIKKIVEGYTEKKYLHQLDTLLQMLLS